MELLETQVSKVTRDHEENLVGMGQMVYRGVPER